MKQLIAIFDLDGTLIDGYQAIHAAINRMLRTLGYKEIGIDLIKRSVGKGEIDIVSRFVEQQHVREALTLYRTFHIEELPHKSVLKNGAMELLEFLRKRDVRLAVVTNRVRQTAEAVTAALDIQRFFSMLVSEEDVKEPKPDPEGILSIITRFKGDTKRSFYVGDMGIDLSAGRNAGVPTYIVLTGSSRRSDFSEDAFPLLFEDLDAVRRRLSFDFPELS